MLSFLYGSKSRDGLARPCRIAWESPAAIQMRLTDLIICYLSIGAPLGVFHYLYNPSRSGRRNIVRSAAQFAFWPFFLTSALVKRVASGEPLRKPENSNITDAYRHVGVKDLQRELELLTLNSGAELSLFEVRDAIERYTELTTAVLESEVPDPTLCKDLFDFGGSAENGIGPLVLSRKNLSRLRHHQARARADIARIVNLCAPFSRKEQAIRTAQTLFAEIGDEAGIEILKASVSGNEAESVVASEDFVTHAA